MAHQDNAPWVWQAARLIDRLEDDDLTVMELADALRDEWERGRTAGIDSRKNILSQHELDEERRLRGATK